MESHQKELKKIVLLIPVYNNAEITHNCLTSIFNCADKNPPFEVLVVDDGSNQETKDCLNSHPVTVITNEKNCGYLKSTNRGISHALESMEADYVALLNNDLEMRDTWLEKMFSLTHIYDLVGYRGRKMLLRKTHDETFYLEGSCILVKKEVFNKIGILDPLYKEGYYSDDDFCLRALLADFKIGVVKNGKPPMVSHHIGQTFGAHKFTIISKTYPVFVNKWLKQKGNSIVDTYFKRYCFNPNTFLVRFELWIYRTFRIGIFKDETS